MNELARTAWIHRKTEIRVSGGMVVARHPYAAEAGATVLKRGGNAVDAVAAASLVNGVVQPFANTIGGGGVLVIYMGSQDATSVDYRYQAPAGARAELFRPESVSVQGLAGWSNVADRRNELGPLSVGVPGSISGLSWAVASHGTLPFRDVVEPAATVARYGYDVDWYGSLMLGVYLNDLRRARHTARTFLRNGAPLRPPVFEAGDRHIQAALADTLDRITSEGPRDFYSGSIAESILRELRPPHGIMASSDLSEYVPRVSKANVVRYHDYRVHFGHHVSVGPILLGILRSLGLQEFEPSDPRRVHLLIEATRIARFIESQFLGEAQLDRGILGLLSSPDYLASLAGAVDHRRSSDDWMALLPSSSGTAGESISRIGTESTVNVAAFDSDRNCACLTETILGNFGSMVTTETGILLNNAIFAFDPVPGSPNSICGGVRPLSNMTPTVVTAPDGSPRVVVGASGGRRISAAVAQILSLMLDHGYGIQDAMAMPRLDVVGSDVLVDSRFPSTLLDKLRAMGHGLVVREESLSSMVFANPGGIQVMDSGELVSGVNHLQTTGAAGY